MPNPWPRSFARILAVPAEVAALLAAACGDGGCPPSGGQRLLIAVNAPFSDDAFVGETVVNGVQLAVDEINEDGGGLRIGNATYQLAVKRYDNGVSAERAAANVRQAVSEGAAAIVDEGTGIEASWKVANDAHVPICIVYQGGVGMVNPGRAKL